ncbi:hypothetical protein [Lactococcus formosensis]|uniref:Uncharacterized protein n=1 Tax=Lactococcus formosensis TaxID=1281486 RepID=A0A9X4SDJ3_9LACT|nr:hypothetical protein [Lactococcus formosensis]MDG6126456.1 hypothetical protein [Lactococcus formosensis]MDG6131856.1 hypothetical protein [Lactococcus formosensis]MDG6133853.1 hypothetical protein [Lactococcus formosensis]MDG6140521.1 hypothetical protein [Lactococcus formosensis]MDG6145063.1 hypothetical protein [Lactococcus formosensis]
MEVLFNYLGELQHPEVMSFILLILAFGDTLTALMWRNKKNIAIFSKTLWVGFALNAFGASIPYLICQVPILDTHDLFVKTVLTLWTLVFGFATGFSLAANYKLYSTKSYEMLMEVVPQVLKAEIENKINKHVKKEIN